MKISILSILCTPEVPVKIEFLLSASVWSQIEASPQWRQLEEYVDELQKADSPNMQKDLEDLWAALQRPSSVEKQFGCFFW
ncbi:MAG: hypothetical protein LBS74_11160 [Oscillospiraceae bacterium]|jgi:hypothetical protein|nr:hypothetical protein [Oscillospiraceae bacterium]